MLFCVENILKAKGYLLGTKGGLRLKTIKIV